MYKKSYFSSIVATFGWLVSLWVLLFAIQWFQYRGVFSSVGRTPLPVYPPCPPPGVEREHRKDKAGRCKRKVEVFVNWVMGYV